LGGILECTAAGSSLLLFAKGAKDGEAKGKKEGKKPDQASWQRGWSTRCYYGCNDQINHSSRLLLPIYHPAPFSPMDMLYMRIHAPTGTHDSPTSIRDPYPLIRDAANGTVELELLKQLRAGSSDSGLALPGNFEAGAGWMQRIDDVIHGAQGRQPDPDQTSAGGRKDDGEAETRRNS
jgi:hypothetical protein